MADDKAPETPPPNEPPEDEEPPPFQPMPELIGHLEREQRATKQAG